MSVIKFSTSKVFINLLKLGCGGCWHLRCSAPLKCISGTRFVGPPWCDNYLRFGWFDSQVKLLTEVYSGWDTATSLLYLKGLSAL